MIFVILFEIILLSCTYIFFSYGLDLVFLSFRNISFTSLKCGAPPNFINVYRAQALVTV